MSEALQNAECKTAGSTEVPNAFGVTLVVAKTANVPAADD